TRPHDHGVLEAMHGSEHGYLYIERQTRRNTVRIYFPAAPTLGFQKDLMARLICEPMNLVFYGGAISWSDTFYRASIAVHWRAVQPRTNNLMCTFVRVSDPTWGLLR